MSGESDMYFMLHIGKTGGTYTKHVFSSIPAAKNLVRPLTHQYTLETALEEFRNENAIFAIRDPLEIFVSGFYSRMRKGQPRYNYPWSPEEATIFSIFKTPNQLAEALDADQSDLRERAQFSMRKLQHVAQCLHFYLHSVASVRKKKSRISFILRQQSLDDDIKRFLQRNSIPVAELPLYDEVIRHSNPAGLDTSLSARAIRNLTEWYETDLDLYRECQSLASEINRL
jgi:hypothetical protein